MVKTFLFLVILTSRSLLWGDEQLIVVISSELNSTTATLQRYEKEESWYKVGESVPVTLGRNGFGWESGNTSLKREGDGRSPAGIFEIHATFGYDENPIGTMPYYYADDNLICVDDSNDIRYNQMALLNPIDPPKSYEVMHRTDGVYRYGAVIGYNPQNNSGRGSCIFFHLKNRQNTPTAGCTAMDEKPLMEMLRWLDPIKKPALLQITDSECERYQKEFVGVGCE